MPSEADYRDQAEALLRLAAAADNMRVRSDLIDEASRWHALAEKAGADSQDRRPPEPQSFLDRNDQRRAPPRPRTSPLRWLFGMS